MADKGRRLPENVAGAYFVDEECIDCDLCREIAADNFERNEDENRSFVLKQPETDDELELCEEARDSCPVEAIGKDESAEQVPPPAEAGAETPPPAPEAPAAASPTTPESS